MIEQELPRDIRTFDDKFVWFLNKRQFVCTTISVAVLIIEWNIVHALNISLGEYGALLMAIPIIPIILIGFKKVNNLPFEIWFSEVFMRYINKSLRVRPYKVENSWRKLNNLLDDDGNILSAKELQKKEKIEKKKKIIAEKKYKNKKRPKINGEYECFY